jgi:hypothetical protein
MWKFVTTAALVAAMSSAAIAQTGSGSTGGSAGGTPGGGGTSATPRVDRAPGATPGRSDIAPGSRRSPAGRVVIPPEQSAAHQSRQGGGTSDLHNNSATIGPTGVGPTGVGPTGVGPTGVGPGVGPSGSASGSALERSPALGIGTGARDTGVPDSSVYNPGAPSRQR